MQSLLEWRNAEKTLYNRKMVKRRANKKIFRYKCFALASCLALFLLCAKYIERSSSTLASVSSGSLFNSTSILAPKPRIAYVTLSYFDNPCASITAMLHVREVLNKYANVTTSIYDIDLIITRIGEPIPEDQLAPHGIIQRQVNPTRAQGTKNSWEHTYSKYWVAKWFEYEAIVYIDSDVMLLRPLNELVELARAIPGTLISPRAYWKPLQPYLMAGTFVLSPSNQTGLATNQHFDALLKNESFGIGVGDMDWFNVKFRDSVTLVSGFYTLLVGEFCPVDVYGLPLHNIWGEELGLDPKEVLDAAPLVHFIAGWKPWSPKNIGLCKDKVTSELRTVYNLWNDVQERACPSIIAKDK